MKNLNVYLGPEGGTTRVALHQVPITFVYRNSLDSHELMPFPVSLSPFSSMPVTSILSLNDRSIYTFFTNNINVLISFLRLLFASPLPRGLHLSPCCGIVISAWDAIADVAQWWHLLAKERVESSNLHPLSASVFSTALIMSLYFLNTFCFPFHMFELPLLLVAPI